MDGLQLKQEVHQHYMQLVQDRIDAFKDMIAALAEDSRNDAKGSAGDKHETALSMMHIEQEKLNRKLQEFLEQKKILERINPNVRHDKISVGSLITANGKHFFVAAALPKITVGETSVIALSPQSPLGSFMVGKTLGDSFRINDSPYYIEAVY